MINSVRNTVLSVLNKNNYGYISPSDFNLYAKQAQMELYEEYFSNYNKTITYENQRLAGTDYASIEKPIAEVLESFLTQNFLYAAPTPSGSTVLGRFFLPSDVTTGDRSYMLSRILYYYKTVIAGNNTSATPFLLIDGLVDFVTAGVNVGDIVINSTTNSNAIVVAIPTTTTLALDKDIFPLVGASYRIFSASVFSEAERVTDGKITALSISPLTAPSVMFPAYTLTDQYLFVYPSSIASVYGSVKASYFRYPKEPKWTYITLVNGEPAFDQTQPDYQDFELPNEDEYKLVMKILQYCGISIREYQVTQYAMGQEQHEQPSFSQQQ